MAYLEGLHSKHEDWLGQGLEATKYIETAYCHPSLILPPDAGSSSSVHLNGLGGKLYGGGASGGNADLGGGWVLDGGLYVPQVPHAISQHLYFLQKERCTPDMHQKLYGVPALVLDCDGDVYRDRGLKEEFQAKVEAYISFMKDFKKHYPQSANRPNAVVTPGGPGLPQETETLTEVGRELNVKIMHTSNGELNPDLTPDTQGVNAAKEVRRNTLSMGGEQSQPSGNLEVLMSAATKVPSRGSAAGATLYTI